MEFKDVEECPVCRYPGIKTTDASGALFTHPGRLAPCRPQLVSGTFASDRVKVAPSTPSPTADRATVPPSAGAHA